MRICIAGAGSVGGLIGGRLAAAGEDVSLIARGPHLEAIRGDGLRLVAPDGAEQILRLPATADPASLPPQDAIFLATKAHDAAALAPSLAPLLAPHTTVVTAMNGIPWWYFHREGGPLDGTRLASVDPDGALAAHVDSGRVLGAVVWLSAEVSAPGVIRHTSGLRLPVGEPHGETSARVSDVAAALARAGFKSPVRTDIRTELWLKLWGNLAFNPVSLLTHATLEDLARDPGTRAVIRAMMTEAQAVAGALGIRFPLDIDARIRGAGEIGPHRTSTLTDLVRGKTVELDALLGAVVEIAEMVGVDTPTLRHVFALAVRRAREAGCYPGP